MLLAPYLVVLVATLCVALDHMSEGQRLRQALPVSPHSVFWYGVLLGLPHILASFVSLRHQGYLAHYRRPLLTSVALAVMALATMVSLLPFWLGMLVFLVLTARHTIGQQAGLSRPYLRVPTRWHVWWRWCVSVGVCILSVEMYFHGITEPPQVLTILHPAMVGLLLTSSVLAVRIALAQGKDWRGAILLMCTQVMAVSCAVFVSLGYPLLAYAVPQLVHDITAFTIYGAHERASGSDLWARIAWWALPVAAVLCALCLTVVQMGWLTLCLSLIHYFFEGVAWRGRSMHRQRVSFSSSLQ
jgi:hypothetical protein